MDRLEELVLLNEILVDEMPGYKESAQRFDMNIQGQRRLLRSLMNVRQPKEVEGRFRKVQDSVLSRETVEKRIVKLDDLQPTMYHEQVYLWQGDITRLQVGAIVNAANSALLGCFVPCHGCIDNAIHSAAGLQLRQECQEIMDKQGHPEETGRAKITGAYNLPCDYVIHTVGPIIQGSLREEECELLGSCYRSCLELAIYNNLESIAFCCISTGEFHFPNEKAAEIAVQVVSEFLETRKKEIKIVFNVFKEEDLHIYENLLKRSSNEFRDEG